MKETKSIVKTGYSFIDDEFGGLKPGELTLIGGRPAMGKTSLALNIALHVAQDGKRVLFFCPASSRTDMELRLVSMISGIPMRRIRNWSLSDLDWDLFHETVQQVQGLPIVFYPYETIPLIKYGFKEMGKKEGIDLIIFDYLQLIHRDITEKEERNTNENLQYLKKAAKKRNVPAIVLTQLSRKLEFRKDKHPRKKDIHRMGIADKSYDQAFLLYRDAYYDIDAPKDSAELIGIRTNNKEIVVGTMCWDWETAAFYDKGVENKIKD